jgi:hypothetical protein
VPSLGDFCRAVNSSSIESLRSSGDTDYVSRIMCILQGVHNVDWRRQAKPDLERHWELLSVGALGDRCPTASNTDRTLQVQRILSDSHHSDITRYGQLHDEISTLLTCLLVVERTLVDEKTSFRIFDLLFAKFATSPRPDPEPNTIIYYDDGAWWPGGDDRILNACGF